MKIQEVPSVTESIPESEIVSGQPILKGGGGGHVPPED